MGHGHHESDEAPPRGRAPLKTPGRRRTAKGTPAPASREGRRESAASARGERDTQERRLRALLEITTKIGALGPTDVLLTAIAEEAARLLDVDNAGFRLVEGDELVLAGIAGSAGQSMATPRIGLRESLSGRVVTERRTLVLSLDEASDTIIPEHLAADRRLGYTTFLGVPIRAGERIIGALTFRARRRFTPADVELAEAFAAQAAIALEHARLVRDATQQAERMAALADVGRLVGETLKVDAVADKIVRSVIALLGAQVGTVLRVEDDGSLRTIAVAGEPAVVKPGLVLPPGTGAAGVAVRERRPIVSPDFLNDPRVPYDPDVRRRLQGGVSRSLLAVPMIAHDRVIGAISIGDRSGRRFDDADVRLAETFAAQAAVALENARLYEETERARQDAEQRVLRLTTLSAVTRLITSTVERETVFDAIAEAAATLLGAKLARVWAADPVARVLHARGGYGIEPGVERVMTEFSEIPFGRGVVGAIFESGRSEYIPDVQEDPRWQNQRLAQEVGLHGYVGLPLVAGDRSIGVLSILFGDRREWTHEDQELATLLASQAATAIDNAALYGAIEVRARRLSTLVRLNELVSSSLDSGAVLSGVARAAAEIMHAPFVAFWLADHASRRLRLSALSAGHAIGDFSVTEVAMDQGAVGWVASERQPLAIDDVVTDGRFVNLDWAQGHGFQSFYGVPIVVDGELMGVLVLVGPQPFRLDRDDRELLDTFRSQAAVAIRNARLYRDAREYAERLRALEEVNRLVSSSLEVDEVLANVARAVAQFFDSPWVTVWSFDETTRRLRRAVAHGDPDLADVRPREFGLGEAVVGWCALHRTPIGWTAVAADERIRDAAALLDRGLHYFTAYPIAIGDRVLGAVVAFRSTPSRVTPETASLLGALAAQAAVAIDHARLYAETSRRLEETRALLEVAEILGSTLEARQLMKRVTMKIAQVCRVDRCTVELWDGDRVIPLMSQFADGHERRDLWDAFRTLPPHPPREVPAYVRAIETRRPVAIDDTSDTDQIPRRWIELFEHTSFMVVPLVRQNQVIGVMNLDYCERVTPFSPRQVDLAMAIAGQLALAIDNTRLYEEVRERLRETSTLLAVGRALSEPGTTDEVMRRVTREVGRAFGCDMVGAYFLDERREVLVPLAGWHVPRDLLPFFTGHPMPLATFPALADAWRAGHAFWSGSPLGDEQFDAAWQTNLPAHSVLIAPAVARGAPIGALFLVWWRPGREFSDAEVRLVEAVARQVGLALENAELARQREVRLKETEILLSVSRALTSTLNLNALHRHFLRQVTRTIEADTVGLWMVSQDGQWLEGTAGYRVPPHVLEALRGVRLSVAEPFYAEAARTLRAVASQDALADPRIPEVVKRLAPHRSQLFVPIVVNERMIGAFAALWWDRVRDFSESELALMDAITNQAGVAIENARLFQENRRQVEELSVLHELSRAVTGQVDRAALLDAVYAQVARVLDVRNMVVLLVNEEAGDLEVAMRVRDGARDYGPPHRYALRAVGLASAMILSGRAIHTDQYAEECRRHGIEPLEAALAFRYWLGVPMRVGATVIGAIALRSVDHPFSGADARLLGNIGDLAALALRSATLYEQRTRAYEDLAAAQDQLVRIEKLRALGEMASGVAHDFNNLLAAILGRAQLLLQRVDEPRLRQWLEVIERASLDGAQTVRRLQEFTRIRRDEPFVAVDLNEVVRDALEITQSRWREEPRSRGVTIEVRTALATVPAVAGDGAELREALTNLILNAVDAMPHGGTLSIATAVVASGVEVTVADTGVGMPENIKRRIFDPFFTTKGPRGTGLGLSITYGILSRHGVVIDLDSQEGRGTTFRLLFAPAPELARVAPPAEAPLSAPGPPLDCLVVDDDEAVAAVVADMIEASGHRAVVVTESLAAIDRFRAGSFDVVFTDLAMPHVSGWDVARAVKAATAGVPVFMVTGFGVELTEEARRQHGVDGVLVKPLRIEDIRDALTQAQRLRRIS